MRRQEPVGKTPLKPAARPGIAAFTLIELLSVLLLPALARARPRAQRIAGFKNERQIMITAQMNSNDWPDYFYYPTGIGAHDAPCFFQLSPETGRPVPIHPTPGYIRKNPRTGQRGPARVVIVMDADDSITPGNPNNNCRDEVNYHGAKAWNWGFADGPAEWVTCRNTARMITNGWMTSGSNGRGN